MMLALSITCQLWKEIWTQEFKMFVVCFVHNALATLWMSTLQTRAIMLENYGKPNKGIYFGLPFVAHCIANTQKPMHMVVCELCKTVSLRQILTEI